MPTSGVPPIRALLAEGESTALDYKREQYVFEKGTDGQKAELLKDILAFANASRRTDAYILIGVRELKNGTGKAVGVKTHLRDAELQQFVNGKTNRPVEFSYRSVSYEGLELGVLTIPMQKRPFCLKKQYAGLRPEAVYIRRGSATEIATLDEVAQMGTADMVAAAHPVLVLELADLGARRPLGAETTARFEVLIPTEALLREEKPATGPFGIPDFRSSLIRRPSRAEIASFVWERSKTLEIGFCVTNTSDVLARNVRAELEVGEALLKVIDVSAGPHPPDPLSPVWFSGSRKDAGVDVTHSNDGRTIISAAFGDVQPGATIYAVEPFLLTVPSPPESDVPLEVNGKLYEDRSRPVEVAFTIRTEMVVRDMRAGDLTPHLRRGDD